MQWVLLSIRNKFGKMLSTGNRQNFTIRNEKKRKKFKIEIIIYVATILFFQRLFRGIKKLLCIPLNREDVQIIIAFNLPVSLCVILWECRKTLGHINFVIIEQNAKMKGNKKARNYGRKLNTYMMTRPGYKLNIKYIVFFSVLEQSQHTKEEYFVEDRGTFTQPAECTILLLRSTQRYWMAYGVKTFPFPM